MTNENVQFKCGLSADLPVSKNAGQFLIETDTGHMHLDDSNNSRILINNRKVALVGNDDIDAAGWHKVADGTLQGYNNVSLIFAVHNTCTNNNESGSGILVIDLRCENDLTLICKTFGWLISSNIIFQNHILNINGNTWTLYYKVQQQHYRMSYEVIQEAGVKSKDASYTLYSNQAREETEPIATVISSSIGHTSSTDSVNSSLTANDSYLEANLGRAIINSTATRGAHVAIAKTNSINGCFTLYNRGSDFNLAYTAQSTIAAQNDSVTHQAVLLNESGNTSFPGTITSNNRAVVTEGRRSDSTIGTLSIALGYDNIAAGNTAISCGNHNESLGNNSFTVGYNNNATDTCSIAMGLSNTSSSPNAIALGYTNTAKNENAIAIGRLNTASGHSSVALGYQTLSSNFASTSCGKFNLMTSGADMNTQIGDAFVVGNGTDSDHKSNAFRITYSGATYANAAYNSSGADYAEFIKEWYDGNPNNEDRVGYMVTIKDGKLYKANEGDHIIGVTSGNPSIIGNSDEEYYWKYKRDNFNRIIYEDIEEEIEKLDEDGRIQLDENGQPIYIKTGKIIKNAKPKLADNYDPSLQNTYIERARRPEWDYVGMRGIIPVRDDGTCVAGGYCKCSNNGIATYSSQQNFNTYFVIERISSDIISVEVK